MRTVRLIDPGIVYHVIWRFVDRDWFITSDEEREQYLRFVAHGLEESDWRCLAYAVMSSHIHMAMLAGAELLADWCKRMHSPFADWMNRRYGRIGCLFTRGPKATAVAPEHQARLLAYIHNNPVRARVVRSADESSWTSHRAYVGLVLAPSWLHVEEGLRRAGFDDRVAFDRFVRGCNSEPDEVALDPFRAAVRKRGAVHLATPTASIPAKVPLVARPYACIRPDPRELVGAASAVTNIPTRTITSRTRDPLSLRGRRIVIHAGRMLGFSYADLGAVLGRTPEAVSLVARRELPSDEVALCGSVVARIEQRYGSIAGPLFRTT